jgi:hypothetical protein
MAPRPLTLLFSLLFAVFSALPSAAMAGGTSSSFDVGIQSDNVLLYGPDVPKALEEVGTLGASPVRISIHWAGIANDCRSLSIDQRRDPKEPCYHWELVDRAVSGARQRGLRILASVSQTPTWLFNDEDPAYIGDTWPQFLRFSSEYQAFVQAAATRYGEDSPIGMIDRWTVWNEPNSSTFWKPQSQDVAKRYAYLYSLAAPEIKARIPLAQVAVGPTGPKSTTKPLDFVRHVQPWLQRFLASRGGASAFVDAWAHNPYPGALLPPDFQVFAPPSVGIGNMDDLLLALDASPATRGIPIWATEYSYQTNPPDSELGVSLQNQADWLADGAFLLWKTHRVDLMIWYVLQDPAQATDWQSGLITAQGKLKPSFEMFRHLVGVSREVAGPGDEIELWGRSSELDGDSRIVISTPHGKWHAAPHQKINDDGTISASIRETGSFRVALQSGAHRGPTRMVRLGAWDDIIAEAGHILGSCARCQ